MREVTVRELRNHGGRVIDRVQTGERLTITRDGHPVAELGPLPRQGLDPVTLLARWRNLPTVDPQQLRHDIDQVIDPAI